MCLNLLMKNTVLEKMLASQLGQEPAVEFVHNLTEGSPSSPGQTEAVRHIIELRQQDPSTHNRFL